MNFKTSTSGVQLEDQNNVKSQTLQRIDWNSICAFCDYCTLISVTGHGLQILTLAPELNCIYFTCDTSRDFYDQKKNLNFLYVRFVPVRCNADSFNILPWLLGIAFPLDFAKIAQGISGVGDGARERPEEHKEVGGRCEEKAKQRRGS